MMILKKRTFVITILSLIVTLMLAMPQTALAVPGTCPAGTTMLTKYHWDDPDGAGPLPWDWYLDGDFPDFITFGPDENGDGPDAQNGSWDTGGILIDAVVITDGQWQGNVISWTYLYDPAVSFGYFHAVDMDYQPVPPHDISNIVFCGGTTPVTLASFTAQASRGTVTLQWVTATEIDTAGFILFRSATEGGARVQVTPALIAAQGGGVTGASYSVTDYPGNGTYYYWLVDVDYSGQSGLHGPAVGKVLPAFRSLEYRPSVPGY
jgi:hypothetical protein